MNIVAQNGGFTWRPGPWSTGESLSTIHGSWSSFLHGGSSTFSIDFLETLGPWSYKLSRQLNSRTDFMGILRWNWGVHWLNMSPVSPHWWTEVDRSFSHGLGDEMSARTSCRMGPTRSQEASASGALNLVGEDNHESRCATVELNSQPLISKYQPLLRFERQKKKYLIKFNALLQSFPALNL
jgi:hypothetical protein